MFAFAGWLCVLLVPAVVDCVLLLDFGLRLLLIVCVCVLVGQGADCFVDICCCVVLWMGCYYSGLVWV